MERFILDALHGDTATQSGTMGDARCPFTFADMERSGHYLRAGGVAAVRLVSYRLKAHKEAKGMVQAGHIL